jgi:hypothetical protein
VLWGDHAKRVSKVGRFILESFIFGAPKLWTWGKFKAHGWFVFKSSPYDLFPPHPLVMVGWNDSISLEAACPNLHGWLWFWDMLVIVVWGVYVCKGLWFGTLGVGV